MPNQYFNAANRAAHYKKTGPGIWDQIEDEVDILVASMGTGGTTSDIGRYLKEKNPTLRIVGADPDGSMYHHNYYKTTGEIRSYKVEGIGEDFLPSILNLKIVDEVILAARELARKERIFAGGSSGAAVFAALQVARRLKNRIIVVILPDTGGN